MSACNLTIINSHAKLIPINKEIKTVYKLFSSVDCDIHVTVPPEISGVVGCRGVNGRRGTSDRPVKITYEEALWNPSQIEIQIKMRKSFDPQTIENLQNITGHPDFPDSINLIFEEDPVTRRVEIRSEFGIYPNDLALKILQNCSSLSAENLCKDSNGALINELTVERPLEKDEKPLHRIIRSKMVNVKGKFVTIKFPASQVSYNLEKLERIRYLF